jgi:hypothetical protein
LRLGTVLALYLGVSGQLTGRTTEKEKLTMLRHDTETKIEPGPEMRLQAQVSEEAISQTAEMAEERMKRVLATLADRYPEAAALVETYGEELLTVYH